jgi:hypothetical protein
MILPADRIAELEHVVRTQMQTIDQLRAEIAQKDAALDEIVQWVASDGDSLSVLRSVYADPRTSRGDKIRACAASIAYEVPKMPAAVVFTMDFRERVKTARLRQLELDKQEWSKLEPPQDQTPAEPAA